MAYDFSTLSHTDFENLARDLIGVELGIRFEAFAEGPDSGIDGRYASSEGSTILQAKQYARSGFKALRSKMAKEREVIDRLKPKSYILATSARLTPSNKDQLAGLIGPWLHTTGDIFGPDDLNALLRKHQEVEQAHPCLWAATTTVLRAVVTEAMGKALANISAVPPPLAKLLPPQARDKPLTAQTPQIEERNVVFIIKSSPVDDEFTLWLAPKLEAEGFRVFADILTLQPGDRWRREVNLALQHRAAKVLLIMRDGIHMDMHIQDDIDTALDVGASLADDRFILPLRLEPTRKMKGIGDAIYIDFVRGWGEGLDALLDALRRQRVPCSPGLNAIDPNWELFRRRGAIPLVDEPERLTSNWLRVVEAPDHIRYFEARGTVDRRLLGQALGAFPYPSIIVGIGFLTFANGPEIADHFGYVGQFEVKHETQLLDFVEKGIPKLGIASRDASNHVVAMLKTAWASLCRRKGFIEYRYTNTIGFHASSAQAPVGQRIPWGKQGERRSSMLRNVAKGHIWQFGVTAAPTLWPFWHVKLKSRVLFAKDNDSPDGLGIDDAKKLHRLRRSLCKGWRNKQWHGRMLAFLELMTGESAYIRLELSPTSVVLLEGTPTLFSSPVSTALPNVLDADEEEMDASTLGRPDTDEEVEE